MVTRTNTEKLKCSGLIFASITCDGHKALWKALRQVYTMCLPKAVWCTLNVKAKPLLPNILKHRSPRNCYNYPDVSHTWKPTNSVANGWQSSIIGTNRARPMSMWKPSTMIQLDIGTDVKCCIKQPPLLLRLHLIFITISTIASTLNNYPSWPAFASQTKLHQMVFAL